MRMNNRFCRMGKTVCGAFLMLSLSGVAYSCSDDYDLPETKPSFLGGSIYDELKSRGKFNYTIKLIEDLEYTEVMAKTGSKTLFVAPDEAYEAFFKNNKWGVKSYGELSPAQKRYLFNSAQFNNAYVVEMMSNNANGEKNVCLRQNSAAAVTDTVARWAPKQLPVNYNEEASELKFWKRHANASDSLYMAVDATVPMLTHFLEGQMNEKSIRKSDISFILNHKEVWPVEEKRSYIYDAKIVDQDIVCMNGYVHVLDKVLVSPGNMAEEIRTNGETNIFSHILDRFSAPYYNATLTTNYNALYGNVADSVFEKRYFAINSKSGKLLKDPDGYDLRGSYPYLTFDPAWNAYAASFTEVKEKDMGAMFVPNDAALSEYFLTGGGRVLMDRYGKKENTAENLLYNIDQIPLDIIQALVNNLMKTSFNETVPSKYLGIMNDARDQMFPISDGYTTEEAYKQIFTKTMLANNGVVYVMNRVISPADYASVIAPALYNSNAQVMRTVVRADDAFVQGNSFANAPLQQYFSTYLKAMQSRFSFFIPTDEGLGSYGYVDPASLALGNSRNYMYWRWVHKADTWGDQQKRIAVDARAYEYNANTGQNPAAQGGDKAKSATYRSLNTDPLSSTYGTVKQKLLIEMVNQHIVVHNNNDTEGVRAKQKYYLSRVGAPVVVKNDEKGVGMKVHGGFQEQIAGTGAEHSCNVVEVYDQTAETNGYGNGMTYFLDRPMQSTTNSAYKILKANANYSKFMELCEGMSDDLLQKAGFRDSLKNDKDGSEWQKVAAKFYIFLQGSKAGVSYNVPNNDKLVRFFNNYRYTIYAPVNEAVEAAIAKGLPTWETIETELAASEANIPTLAADESNKAEYEAAVKAHSEVKLKAQAKITLLLNFLKYHFQDESLFVDNVTSKDDYMTSCVDEVNKVYLSVNAEQSNGAIKLTDLSGQTVMVDTNHCNILVRDANYNSATAPTFIRSSSYAVVHQINKALVFDKQLATQGFKSAWATSKKAQAFVAKYKIKE